MANTKQQPKETLGFFQAVSTAAVSPIKGAASVGLMVGTLADALWARREYVKSTVQDTVDLVALAAAAAAAKAKKEMLGEIVNIEDIDKTLKEIEAHWTK